MDTRAESTKMKSPTDKFKKNMQSIGGKKGKNKVTVIDAPVSFTDEELEQYEYWLALQSCIPWLYEKPKDKFSKDLLRDFMALYAKIKMAMQAVVPGKVNVSVGKGRTDGQDLEHPCGQDGEAYKDLPRTDSEVGGRHRAQRHEDCRPRERHQEDGGFRQGEQKSACKVSGAVAR